MFYWVSTAIFISVLIVLVGLLSNNETLMGSANASDTTKAHHASIIQIERLMTQADFDLSKKHDLLRKTRIEFYLAEAKQADLRQWAFKRDDLVERAKGILVHHQSHGTTTNSQFERI